MSNSIFTTMNLVQYFRFFCFILGAALILPSCEKIEGEGPVVSEIRNRTGYEGLQVSICGKINFEVANQYKVEVFAQRDILEVLQTEVDDEILEIKWTRPVQVQNCRDIVVNISGPALRYVHTNGSSDIEVNGTVVSPFLELVISGSGSIEMDRAEISNEISARLSGSGNISIDGGVGKETEIAVSGSGGIDLGKIKVDNADCKISGSGNITVQVEKFLDASISGSGDVYYYGSPVVKSKISGSGKVRQL